MRLDTYCMLPAMHASILLLRALPTLHPLHCCMLANGQSASCVLGELHTFVSGNFHGHLTTFKHCENVYGLPGAGASELAVSTLHHLMHPLGPSTVWQAIHGMLFICRLERAPTVCCMLVSFSAHHVAAQHSLPEFASQCGVAFCSLSLVARALNKLYFQTYWPLFKSKTMSSNTVSHLQVKLYVCQSF